MNTYDFILKFALPESENDTDALVEHLFEAGCNDALIGTGRPGRVALFFSREEQTISKAVASAISNVKQAVPKAKLVEFEVEEELNTEELTDLGSVEEIDTLMLQGILRQQLDVPEKVAL